MVAVAFHLDSDRPDETQQFTAHSGHNLPFIFAGARQAAMALVEPVRRLPCNCFDSGIPDSFTVGEIAHNILMIMLRDFMDPWSFNQKKLMKCYKRVSLTWREADSILC